jgi:tetratricopeptide (TPR) repeat protein
VGVIAVLLAIGVGAVIYYAKTQEPEKPKPPVEAMKADAGAPAPSKDVGLADAVAAKDAEPAKDVAPDAAAVTPEQVVDARGKAREVMFELAFSRMFHPDTGLPLVADKDAPPVVEDPNAKPPVDGAKPPVDGAKVDGAKPPVDGAKAGGGDKVAPVVDKGPKEVKEPPISTAPDPVKFDDKGAKQEFDRRFKAGAALAKSGKCDKAIPELQAADSVQGGSSQVNSLLGRCFMSTGGFAKAVTYLEKAVRLNGTNADAVRMLGDAYQATGQRGKAIDAYRKYLELRPTGAVSDEIRRILAQYH